MRNRKGKHIMRIMAALLSALTIFGFGGCRGKPPLAPVTGGVTDKTDRKAPKVIESKDISDYYAAFLLSGEWSQGNKNVFYTFAVKPDDSGVLTATESVTGTSAPADKELLDALQAIIDECKLAEWNGEYRITAGLPPEYQPSTLTVNYASGEKLTFTLNNEPSWEWSRATYLAFANWFAARGIDALTPPEAVVGTVDNVALTLRDPENDSIRDYGIWSEPDAEGRRMFCRFIGREKTEAPITDEQAFFAGVNEILTHYDLRRYDTHSSLYGYEQTEEDWETMSADLELTFWFENDSQMNVYTSVPKEIDALRPLVGELIDYFDAQLAGN